MAAELSGTQLLAAAAQVLTDSGYVGAPIPKETSPNGFVARLFEDRYGIVALCIFDSWGELVEDWPNAQGQLVDLMSETLRRPEPKAWEGYLVLMTPGFMPAAERVTINTLRADTNRVRKLVAAGDELGTLEDIRNFMLPLLPLEVDESLTEEADLLESLPALLQEQGVATLVTQEVLDAFVANESILQRLHELGSGS
jgi:hypothetical protein